MSSQFIIEHDTRGVLIDQDADPYGHGPCVYLEWRSRFSPTKPRTEGIVFQSPDAVRLAWSRMSPRLRREAHVRRWGTWSNVTMADLDVAPVVAERDTIALAVNALTDEALAHRLTLVRDEPRTFPRHERDAYITEAARRLTTRKAGA